jgi:hypothetical protein
LERPRLAATAHEAVGGPRMGLGARDAKPVPGGFAVPAACKTPIYGGSPGYARADRRLQAAYR